MQNRALVSLLAGAVLTGCGNPIDCAINGDNLEGRVSFGRGVAIRTDKNVVVQWSTTSFATAGSSTQESNSHGLVSVPYGFCVPEGTYQLRAFQDLNGNQELDAGEPSGLLDGTDTGDAGYVSKTVAKDANDTYQRVTDADIVIDNP